MNPGVAEEVGKVAGAGIEALKTTPVVLALVIFNVIYMLGGFYMAVKQGENWDKGAERWKSIADTAMKYCVHQPQAMITPGKWRLQSEESVPVELLPLPQARPEEASKE